MGKTTELSLGTPTANDLIDFVDITGPTSKKATMASIVALASGSGFPGGTEAQLQYKSGSGFAGVGLTDGEALKLTVDNPTLSGNTTERYGLNLTSTYDSTTVDPLFANQVGLSNVLTSLNGQNQYGGGTNAKQSFLNTTNLHNAIASGQHFIESNYLIADGMGDAFLQAQRMDIRGGISANGDEGAAFWTTLFQHAQSLAVTTIVSVTTPATISTTLTQAVSKSQTAQAVTVASSAGVSAGQWIVIDHDDGYNVEAVKVVSVGVGMITAVFRSNHSNGDSVRPATVLVVSSGSGFGQGRPLINLSASPYTTGTANVSASSSTVVGAGTSWANNMVGGDAHIPGYISFTDDDILGSFGTLKGWYPITAVGGGTSLSLFRLDVLGSAGYPANGRAIGGSNYTILPGAKILMFDGSTNTVVLETNAFTWTAAQTVECAFSVNNEWTGLLMRFYPYMPGRYDAGILIRNSGEFSMMTGLSVDATGNGSWDVGASLIASTGVRVGATSKALEILMSGGSGDVHWALTGYGISMGGNAFYDPGSSGGSMVLSTRANDAAGGYDAHESGVEANNGVLSLAYNSAHSPMRWNGDSWHTNLARYGISSGLSVYLMGANSGHIGHNLFFNGTNWVFGANSLGNYGNALTFNSVSGEYIWYCSSAIGNDGATATLFQTLALGATGNLAVTGTVDATGYKAGGTSGVASFGPAHPASITVKNGIVTAIS